MNPRIRELAEQAEDWADSQNFYESDYRDYLMEKFAELIVRECTQIVTDAVDHREPASTYAGKIREHFGVKQ